MKISHGEFTEKVKEISKKHLSREITEKEFKIIPFVNFYIVSNNFIENNFNHSQLNILNKWLKEFIGLSFFPLKITKEFWSFINEIIYYGYILPSEHNNFTGNNELLIDNNGKKEFSFNKIINFIERIIKENDINQQTLFEDALEVGFIGKKTYSYIIECYENNDIELTQEFKKMLKEKVELDNSIL